MYTPAHFAEDRLPVLQSLMQAYPLATLITLTADGLVANHIPLRFTPAQDPSATSEAAAGAVPVGLLTGHVARANPLWQAFDAATDVLAIFQGPQAYISPSWYPTKREHGRVVPTWNYAVVHAHGRLRIRDDAAWAHALVDELTREHEAARPAPWAVTDAPADYIAQLTRAIVGIEIPVTRLAGKWKTSGNQPAVNRVGVAQALAASAADTDRRMAALVAAHDGHAPAATPDLAPTLTPTLSRRERG
jgi:transcriptional regulator